MAFTVLMKAGSCSFNSFILFGVLGEGSVNARGICDFDIGVRGRRVAVVVTERTGSAFVTLMSAFPGVVTLVIEDGEASGAAGGSSVAGVAGEADGAVVSNTEGSEMIISGSNALYVCTWSSSGLLLPSSGFCSFAEVGVSSRGLRA